MREDHVDALRVIARDELGATRVSRSIDVDDRDRKLAKIGLSNGQGITDALASVAAPSAPCLIRVRRVVINSSILVVVSFHSGALASAARDYMPR